MRRLLTAIAVLLIIGVELILLPILGYTNWLTAVTALLVVVTAVPHLYSRSLYGSLYLTLM